MTDVNRRNFLKASSGIGIATLATTAFPYQRGIAQRLLSNAQLMEDGFPRLAAVGLDAARAATATYAEVHHSTRLREAWAFRGRDYSQPDQDVLIGTSVRALVNGCWGVAGYGGLPTTEMMARLGRAAALQAMIAAKGKSRTVELATVSQPATGTWTMPVETDPFSVSYEEKVDFCIGTNEFIARRRYGVSGMMALDFFRETRAFASTEGACIRQTSYRTGADLTIGTAADWLTEQPGTQSANFLTLAGAGWEYVRSAPIQDRAEQLIDDALRSRRTKPVTIGRYDVVFDAQAIAALLSVTLAPATALDRIMGYEANGAGTSFITDPLEMLGTLKIGSPLLTLTVNRSMPGGAATVRWDDEGVEPRSTTIVQDGILHDVQTTRESASWMAPYYRARGMAVASNGCANQFIPTLPVRSCHPNFVLTPGRTVMSFADMVKDTKDGLAVLGGTPDTDFQALNGTGQGTVYEIKNGQMRSCLSGGKYLFRTPDLWRNVVAIGGQETVGAYGFTQWREGGDAAYTVSAVPAKITGVAVTEAMKKA